MLGFRVWDSKNGTFVHQTDFFLCEQGELFFKDRDGYISETTTFFIPMQSTGIHDCRGKLIYENDIIQVNLNGKIFNVFVGEVTEFLRQVGEWGAALQHDSDEHFEYIIILCGNKFEHPEKRMTS